MDDGKQELVEFLETSISTWELIVCFLFFSFSDFFFLNDDIIVFKHIDFIH